MQRILEQLLRLGHFHNPALVDDHNAVGDKPDDRQVVRNEQIGQPALLLEFLQQVQHLGPDGNVQCGDRLVTDYKLGI